MSLLLSLALLLEPATQPVKPLPTERVVTDAKYRFHFAVPKAWKEVPQQPNDAAALYVFQLPATGESRKANPSLIITAEDAKGTDLPTAVEHRRDVIKQRNADVKITTDEASSVAGHDAWTFAYDTTLTVTVTSNGKSHQEKMPLKVRDQVSIVDGRVIEIVMSSDAQGMALRSKLVDRVTSTFVVDP